MEAPDFWQNQEKAQRVSQLVAGIRRQIDSFTTLQQQLEDASVLLELGGEAEDQETLEEAQEVLHKVEKQVSELETQLLLSGPYDQRNAIVSLHAGAGGVDAQDWVEILLRMYLRWAEKQGWSTDIIDQLSGDEAGLKSVTVEFVGPMAYGYFQAEKGVHRLVRISPFDSGARRHTSFASVDVMPEVEENAEVEINSEDLRIDTFRAGGAGGQHVNKTDSAVRITHLPTGVVVSCQNERSQQANRNAAMKLLRAKLLDLKIREQEAQIEEIRGEHHDIAWGSQIRSYVMHPYSMVKDHRTKAEKGSVQEVLDGGLDEFVHAYLIWKTQQ